MKENWYWIELIGFDRTQGDFGVKAFVDNVSGRIEGISFLFSDIDFVNLHDGITGKTLRPCDCSYGGLPCSEERNRQAWTDEELKGLVACLHEYGIKVLFSFFNTFTYGNDCGQMEIGAFCGAHKEIWYLDKNGNESFGVNVLKTLKDGTMYEDFLFAQIERVRRDYGFDGVHLADGISTARPSVLNGDFSDDIVGQFLKYDMGIKNIPAVVKTKKEYRERRAQIVEHYYFEFITFLSRRWAAYYKKAHQRIGGMMIFNNAWTCDPFDSLYRYGFDYNLIETEKSSAMMMEEVSATRPILSKADNGGYKNTEKDILGYHYKYMLTQMSLKAALPRLKILPLTPVKDTAEQWDLLRHNPMELTRAIYRRNNTYIYRDGLKKCVGAPFFCLSNGLKKSDWDWLNDTYEASARPSIDAVCGYTALFSKTRMYAELKEYIRTKEYPSNELNYQLSIQGLDIGCMAEAAELWKINTPILVTNYHLLDEKEKEIVKKIKAPLVVLGKNVDFGTRFSAYYDIALNNMTGYEGIEKDFERLKKYAVPAKATKGEAPLGGLWTCPLSYRRLPDPYFRVLAEILSKAAGLFLPREKVHLTKQKISDGAYRYLISNDTYGYVLPELRHGSPIKNALSVTKYKGYKVYVEGDAFVDRVPPRGMSIVELEET